MFADIELIGIPHRVVVSGRGLAAGTFEYRARAAEESENLDRGKQLARLQSPPRLEAPPLQGLGKAKPAVRLIQIGPAPGMDRELDYVEISVVAVAYQKQSLQQ